MEPLTCPDVRQLVSDLLAGVIEPEQADALDAHLVACASCREEARRYCRLDRALGELAARQRLEQTETKIRAALSFSRQPKASAFARGRWLLGLAASFLFIGIGLYLYWQRQTANAVPAIARLDQVQGEVYLVQGESRTLARAGDPVSSGQGLHTVGEESAAVVAFLDATRLDIGPDTALAELRDGDPAVEAGGKKVVLADGFLSADVAKQPEGRPMVLVTPHARVVVQGTRFHVANSKEATRFELEEGAVQLTRRSDGKSVDLAEGTFSVVRPADESFAPQPLPPRLTKPRASLPENSGRVLCLAFAPDGRKLATGGRDGHVKLWNVDQDEDPEPTPVYQHLRSEVRSLIWSPDGVLLASGGDDNLVKLWDLMRREEIATLKGHRSWIESLAFLPDGKTLLVAGAHGHDGAKIRWWDLSSGKIRFTEEGHPGGVWIVALSPDRKTLASGGRDGIVKLWDLDTRKLKQMLVGHTHEVCSLAFSPDGKTIASSSKDRTVKVWDLATGQDMATLIGHSYDIRGVAISPDGKTIASASNDVKLWNADDFRERATLKGHGGGVWCVAFSPDGRTLAAGGSFKNVKLWDVSKE